METKKKEERENSENAKSINIHDLPWNAQISNKRIWAQDSPLGLWHQFLFEDDHTVSLLPRNIEHSRRFLLRFISIQKKSLKETTMANVAKGPKIFGPFLFLFWEFLIWWIQIGHSLPGKGNPLGGTGRPEATPGDNGVGKVKA